MRLKNYNIFGLLSGSCLIAGYFLPFATAHLILHFSGYGITAESLSHPHEQRNYYWLITALLPLIMGVLSIARGLINKPLVHFIVISLAAPFLAYAAFFAMLIFVFAAPSSVFHTGFYFNVAGILLLIISIITYMFGQQKESNKD